MSREKQRKVKQLLKQAGYTKKIKNAKVELHYMTLSYEETMGYKVALECEVAGSTIHINGVLDVHALGVGKKPIRILTPKDEQIPEYFMSYNVYELHILKKDAPCLYSIIVGWRNTIMSFLDNGHFDPRKNGIVFIPRIDRKYSDDELVNHVVWRHSYDSDVAQEYNKELLSQRANNTSSENEHDGKNEVKLSAWLWSFLHTRTLVRAMMQLNNPSHYKTKDIREEVDYAVAKYIEVTGEDISWDQFIARAIIYNWTYECTTYVRVKFPGMDDTYLVLNEDYTGVTPKQFSNEDDEDYILEQSLLPIDFVDEAYHGFMDVVTDEDDTSLIETLKSQWEERP